MFRFATVAATALCLCTSWSASASIITVPADGRTRSAAALPLVDTALICSERCSYYGCRQICVHRPGYGTYEPYGAHPSYEWYGYAREPRRGRWWHEHEHEHEHLGRYEHEREYEHED
jgi:hypothetical protein